MEDRCSHCQRAFLASQKVCVQCGRSPVDAHDRCAYHANLYRYRNDVCWVVDDVGDACTRPVVGPTGLCGMHARRVRTTGNTGPVESLIAVAGAGCLDKTTGYRYVSAGGRWLLEHRVIMERMLGRELRSSRDGSPPERRPR